MTETANNGPKEVVPTKIRDGHQLGLVRSQLEPTQVPTKSERQRSKLVYDVRPFWEI